MAAKRYPNLICSWFSHAPTNYSLENESQSVLCGRRNWHCGSDYTPIWQTEPECYRQPNPYSNKSTVSQNEITLINNYVGIHIMNFSLDRTMYGWRGIQLLSQIIGQLRNPWQRWEIYDRYCESNGMIEFIIWGETAPDFPDVAFFRHKTKKMRIIWKCKKYSLTFSSVTPNIIQKFNRLGVKNISAFQQLDMHLFSTYQ